MPERPADRPEASRPPMRGGADVPEHAEPGRPSDTRERAHDDRAPEAVEDRPEVRRAVDDDTTSEAFTTEPEQDTGADADEGTEGPVFREPQPPPDGPAD
ncbi:hypothetical protein ACFOOM_17970 [Streptomyces echinoruber]|uniref:Uncharacterized protein n=1 Tax=Streptomyces echinoruber TaxID=68898 RepID=A0A918RPL2_9ACTN|nr:hypothetical protein [Streptomyces echinoruber]GHA03665.1 hypothetical protein GCM10010389_48820 [Streptomyces echinoruber]